MACQMYNGLLKLNVQKTKERNILHFCCSAECRVNMRLHVMCSVIYTKRNVTTKKKFANNGVNCNMWEYSRNN